MLATHCFEPGAAMNAVRDTTGLGDGSVRAFTLPEGVGYLGLDWFWPLERGGAVVAGALREVARTDALIIDLRRNAGGDSRTAALLTSLLFDTEPALLEDRYLDPVSGRIAASKVAVVPFDGPVFVLVGRLTSELAWCFARALRALHRGLVAGELPDVALPEQLGELDLSVPETAALQRSHARLILRSR